ncbi:MAG: NAD-dependent epimerase/dehydratase family protein [Bacteroidetes bacterium]|nr:NAD-dependent epimerase/dehydratase family protein [Bacteroidota bacterium]
MNRCLVIGGSGFIGTHVIRRLLQSGREVSILDIRDSAEFKGRVTFFDNSALGDEDLVRLFDEHDEVVDLAYLSNPKTSYSDPLKDIIENLQSTVKLFTLAAESKRLKKFLYVSSGGALYGNTAVELIDEEHATNPISPYGITKLAIEKYGFMFRYSKDFPFLAVRPSNAYGPGQGANRGQGFVAQAIYNITHGDPVVIFGAEGTIRDYIYITDLAEGIFAVLEKGRIGEMYNLATGVGLSNLQIIRVLEELCATRGLNVKYQTLPERKFDVNKNILDCSKIEQDCQWRARVGITDGLVNTLDYSLTNRL